MSNYSLVKAIIHYRDEGWYENDDPEFLTPNIVGFLVEGLWHTIVDIHAYELELENQCDYSEANPSPEKFMNCYLIMELESEWIEDHAKHISDINRSFLSQLEVTPAMVTKHWHCGNEKFYLVEMSAAFERVDIDLDL